jgi:preprotein translocase subunit SecG
VLYSFSMTISSVLPYIQIIISVLLVAVVLLQQSEAELGGAFGGSDSFGQGYHTRRGMEKVIFNATIILGVLFIITSFLNLIIR